MQTARRTETQLQNCSVHRCAPSHCFQQQPTAAASPRGPGLPADRTQRSIRGGEEPALGAHTPARRAGVGSALFLPTVWSRRGTCTLGERHQHTRFRQSATCSFRERSQTKEKLRPPAPPTHTLAISPPPRGAPPRLRRPQPNSPPEARAPLSSRRAGDAQPPAPTRMRQADDRAFRACQGPYPPRGSAPSGPAGPPGR